MSPMEDLPWLEEFSAVLNVFKFERTASVWQALTLWCIHLLTKFPSWSTKLLIPSLTLLNKFKLLKQMLGFSADSCQRLMTTALHLPFTVIVSAFSCSTTELLSQIQNKTSLDVIDFHHHHPQSSPAAMQSPATPDKVSLILCVYTNRTLIKVIQKQPGRASKPKTAFWLFLLPTTSWVVPRSGRSSDKKTNHCFGINHLLNTEWLEASLESLAGWQLPLEKAGRKKRLNLLSFESSHTTELLPGSVHWEAVITSLPILL